MEPYLVQHDAKMKILSFELTIHDLWQSQRTNQRDDQKESKKDSFVVTFTTYTVFSKIAAWCSRVHPNLGVNIHDLRDRNSLTAVRYFEHTHTQKGACMDIAIHHKKGKYQCFFISHKATGERNTFVATFQQIIPIKSRPNIMQPQKDCTSLINLQSRASYRQHH